MSRLIQDIAAAQSKAALLSLLQAHSTEKAEPVRVTVTVSLDDGCFCEGDYTIEVFAMGRVVPGAGGSL